VAGRAFRGGDPLRFYAPTVELTSLRYFRTLAASGHMTRAARELGLSQPALSTMLKKLEAEVGTELFHRRGRGLELSEAGKIFLQHAITSLRAADAAVDAVREHIGIETGSIRIGGGATATSYLLPSVVRAARKRFPKVRFFVREAGSTQVARAVLEGELDLGIVTLPITLPDADRLVRIPLTDDELRLIAPPRSEFTAQGGTFRFKDLAGASIVGFEAGSAVRDVIDRAAAKAGVTLNYVMELRSIDAITRMVSAGIGLGFVSRFALPPGGGLACADGSLTRTLAIVRLRGRTPRGAPREFERLLVESV